MKRMDFFQEREPRVPPFRLSVALLFVLVGINISATVLSLLLASQG
jgi:hypothetical protein